MRGRRSRIEPCDCLRLCRVWQPCRWRAQPSRMGRNRRTGPDWSSEGRRRSRRAGRRLSRKREAAQPQQSTAGAATAGDAAREPENRSQAQPQNRAQPEPQNRPQPQPEARPAQPQHRPQPAQPAPQAQPQPEARPAQPQNRPQPAQPAARQAQPQPEARPAQPQPSTTGAAAASAATCTGSATASGAGYDLRRRSTLRRPRGRRIRRTTYPSLGLEFDCHSSQSGCDGWGARRLWRGKRQLRDAFASLRMTTFEDLAAETRVGRAGWR